MIIGYLNEKVIIPYIVITKSDYNSVVPKISNPNLYHMHFVHQRHIVVYLLDVIVYLVDATAQGRL